MPNLSPVNVRKNTTYMTIKYVLGRSRECNVCLRNRVASIGYEDCGSRGDYNDISASTTEGERKKAYPKTIIDFGL